MKRHRASGIFSTVGAEATPRGVMTRDDGTRPTRPPEVEVERGSRPTEGVTDGS